MLVRAWFVLVVSDLKAVPRGRHGRGAGFKLDTTRLAWGERSRGWRGAWPLSSKPHDKRGNANGAERAAGGEFVGTLEGLPDLRIQTVNWVLT